MGSLAPPVTIGPAVPGGIPAPPRLATRPPAAAPAPPALTSEPRFGGGGADAGAFPAPPAVTAESRFGGGDAVAFPAAAVPAPAVPVPAGEPTTTRSGLSRRIRGAHGAEDTSPSLMRGSNEPVPADVDVLDFFAGYSRGEGEDG